MNVRASTFEGAVSGMATLLSSTNATVASTMIARRPVCPLRRQPIPVAALVVQAPHGQVDGGPRHPACQIGGDKDRHVCQLLECHEPSRVGPACEQLFPLLPAQSRCFGARLEGFFD